MSIGFADLRSMVANNDSMGKAFSVTPFCISALKVEAMLNVETGDAARGNGATGMVKPTAGNVAWLL